MQALIEQSEKMINTDIVKIVNECLNENKVKELMIDSNQERLRAKGFDIFGDKLRTYKAELSNVYAHYMINLRSIDGKQFDHVDLYQEGDFYDSMKVKLKGKRWYIEANFKKPDGDISDNLDVSFVLGFSDETIFEIVEMIEPMISEKLLKSYGIL